MKKLKYNKCHTEKDVIDWIVLINKHFIGFQQEKKNRIVEVRKNGNKFKVTKNFVTEEYIGGSCYKNLHSYIPTPDISRVINLVSKFKEKFSVRWDAYEKSISFFDKEESKVLLKFLIEKHCAFCDRQLIVNLVKPILSEDDRRILYFLTFKQHNNLSRV